jgi:tetratricopeptide (TPR) repeat protein
MHFFMKRNITRNHSWHYLVILMLFIGIGIFSSCKKYLDKKAVITDAVPSNLDDLQALLDNPDIMTSRSSGLLELLADNYYIASNDYASNAGEIATRLYIWDKDADEQNSWNNYYTGPVYYSNIVLDYLSLVTTLPEETNKFAQLKGEALFYRAFAFYELAQLYCKPFSATAATDPGIVLKSTSSINEPITRASVQQTYDRIISDVQEAATLLPSTVAVPTRPSKVAAYALLARTYLSMRDYENASHYADLALDIYNTLMDYNSLVPVGSPPIPTFNPEVIFHRYVGAAPTILAGGSTKIDSLLYQSYNQNDLRKTVFFLTNTGSNEGTYRFQGSYHGSLGPSRIFTGLTTDELYLIRAESQAKAGNTSEALTDLNDLMRNRWLDGQFTDITALTATEALQKIRTERRKELLFRGQRWTDIRRYNLEDSAITLKRIINGVTYTLPPNDNRWQILIPWNEVNRSSITQNPR